MRLQGKSAIVTGAARGIGKAIAASFCREGARVMLADRDGAENQKTAEELRKTGYEASAFTADVSSPEEVQELFRFTLENRGVLHILVNNAAAWAGDGKILDVSDEAWNQNVDACLKSVFLCMQQAIPAMIDAGGGSIINISSVNALVGYHLTAYTAAKGGILSMTRLVAVQYGPRNIRCNVICPGTIVTETTREAFDKNPKLEKQMHELVPLGRLGKPDDIANCALFLASDESQFATGAVFTIDGGATAGHVLDL